MSEKDSLLRIREEEEDQGEIRECDSSCSHFDSINMCCWQSGPWGLCFDRERGDLCRLGYRERDFR